MNGILWIIQLIFKVMYLQVMEAKVTLNTVNIEKNTGMLLEIHGCIIYCIYSL